MEKSPISFINPRFRTMLADLLEIGKIQQKYEVGNVHCVTQQSWK